MASTKSGRKQPKPTLKKLGGDYASDTEQWFEAWRGSPRTDGFDAAQWQYMKDTAVIHTLIYGQGMFELMPELDKRLKYLGLTFDAAPRVASEPGKVSKLELIQGRRAEKARKARAAG